MEPNKDDVAKALIVKAVNDASQRALAIVRDVATASFRDVMRKEARRIAREEALNVQRARQFKRREDEDPEEPEEEEERHRPVEVERASRQERMARLARIVRDNVGNLAEVMEALKARMRQRGIDLDEEAVDEATMDLAEEAEELEKMFTGYSGGHPLTLDPDRRLSGRFPGSTDQGHEMNETADEDREYDRDDLPKHRSKPRTAHPQGHPRFTSDTDPNVTPGVSKSRKGSIPFGPSRWRRER